MHFILIKPGTSRPSKGFKNIRNGHFFAFFSFWPCNFIDTYALHSTAWHLSTVYSVCMALRGGMETARRLIFSKRETTSLATVSAAQDSLHLFFFSFFLFGFDYYGPRLRLMLSVPQQSRLWAELVDSQTRTRGSSQGKSYPSPRVLYQRKYHHRPTLLYLFENNLMTGETEKKKKKPANHVPRVRQPVLFFWIYQKDRLSLLGLMSRRINMRLYGPCHVGI